MLSSHWYMLFMSLHIGMHAKMIAEKMSIKGGMSLIIFRIIFILMALYGSYAFIMRGVWQYLILKQQFFFLSLESGYIMFFIDYFAIIVLFAVISHYLASLLKMKKKK